MQNSENCDRRRSLSQTMKDGDSTVMVRSGSSDPQRSRTGGSVSPAGRRSREKSAAIPLSDSWAGPSSPSSVWALWRAVWWQWALCTMWCRLRPVTATSLNLDNIELSQSSLVVATDPDTGAQVEYATLRSSNSHRVWADLEQIPTNLQYAFICTEDKDFYSEPGVNFKRTIGAMINEYRCPSTAPSRAPPRWNSSSSRT